MTLPASMLERDGHDLARPVGARSQEEALTLRA
jgi:hypothetical protein